MSKVMIWKNDGVIVGVAVEDPEAEVFLVDRDGDDFTLSDGSQASVCCLSDLCFPWDEDCDDAHQKLDEPKTR